MSLEDTLRQIIREELAAAFADRDDHPPPLKTHVSSTELMAALGISRGTVRRMLAEGCPHVRPGINPRFNLDDVKRYLDAKQERAGNGGA